MKKSMIALVLSFVMAVGSFGGSSAFAAETTAEEKAITDEEQEEPVEETEPVQIEEEQEALADSASGESVAQVIWTAGNTTLTFYYGPLVSEGSLYNGETVTNCWSGESVTNSGNVYPEWYSVVKADVTSVVVDQSFSIVKPKCMAGWFREFKNVTSLDLSLFDTSEVTSMSRMFTLCTNLTSLDMSGFDTSNVKDMSFMFNCCFALESLDVSGLETSKVTKMTEMFCFCENLTSLDVSRFDMSNVTDIACMFAYCYELESLNLSGLDMSNVTNMRATFKDSAKLTSLDLSGVDDNTLSTYHEAFSGCENLETIYCKNSTTCWDPHGGYSGSVELPVFKNCKALIGVDGDTHVNYSSYSINASMAKAASLGGYFTPKNLGPEYYDPDDVEVSVEILQAFAEHKESGQVVIDSFMWSFPNWANYFPESDKGCYISRNDFLKLAKGLSNTERFRLLGETRPDTGLNLLKEENCWTQKLNVEGLGTPSRWDEDSQRLIEGDTVGWGGSCAGMSTLALLINNGVLDASDIDSDADYTSEIEANRDAASAIHFYHVQQGATYQEQVNNDFYQLGVSGGQAAQLAECEQLAQKANDDGTLFEITFQWFSRGEDNKWDFCGHTILGFGLEKGIERTYKDIEYTNRILTYDVSNPYDDLTTAGDERDLFDIYYNDAGQFCIPGWGIISSSIDMFENENDNGRLILATDDDKVLNTVDYVTGLRQFNEIEEDLYYVLTRVSDFTLIIKDVVTGEIWRVTREGSTSDNSLKRLTVFASSNVHRESSANIEYTIVFPDPTHEYTITTESSGIDCTVYRGDYLAEVKTDTPGELIVGNRGEVDVNTNSKGNLFITMVSDELFDSTEADQINITGSGVSSFESQSDENGITIKADNDGSLSINGSSDDNSFSETIENIQGEVVINENRVTQTVESGTCGENLNWMFDSEGTLTISGTGDMYDYDLSSNKAPWLTTEIMTALKSVIIKNGVTKIGEYAFFGCNNSMSIRVPDSVVSIGNYAFFGCKGLEKVIIPEGVANIGISAFHWCTGIESLEIPSSVESIGNMAFKGCTSLTDITVDSENAAYSSVDGVMLNKDQTELICCPAGKEGLYSVPNGVKKIGTFSFSGCSGLTGVSIPTGVNEINDYAFEDCTGLTSIAIPSSVTKIGIHACNRCSNLSVIYFIGTEEEWNAINTHSENSELLNANFIYVDDASSLSYAEVTDIPDTEYTGSAIMPDFEVHQLCTVLEEGKDYTVSYSDNVNAGTASVTITGKGNYTGSVTKTFTINKAANKITAKSFKKTYSTKAQSFWLGAKATGGTRTYKSNNKSVTISKAGKVTIKAKFIGKATITITAQNNNYKKATKKITVTVNPTKTTLSSVTSPSAGKMTVKWKKNAVGTGYQIQFSTSSKFTSTKSAWVTKNSTVSKTIGSLTKGKKYYVRIRTYKKVGTVKYYSAWSAAKAVTIKK